MLAALASPGSIAFQVGPLVVRWYGILMATAIVVGLWLAHRRAKAEGLPADDTKVVATGLSGGTPVDIAEFKQWLRERPEASGDAKAD